MKKEKYITALSELVTRFCYRNGRHGETYLLEKGLREGLNGELLKLRNRDVKELKEEISKVVRMAFLGYEAGRVNGLTGYKAAEMTIEEIDKKIDEAIES